MSRVIHFEIPADDPKRAISFYEKAFGWQFQKFDGPMEYWMVVTGEEGQRGIDGGLLKRQHAGHVPATVIGVESVSAAVKVVKGAGGKVVAPRSAIPGVGYVAYFTDPEENVFGVFQADASAA